MEFEIGLEVPFCTLFKEIQEISPYIYSSDKCNNFVCVNMYYVMHIIVGSQQIKFGETYVKFVKTGQSDLANQNIQFSQHNQKNRNIWFGKSDYLVFPNRSY
jgi:hypothetical protein